MAIAALSGSSPNTEPGDVSAGTSSQQELVTANNKKSGGSSSGGVELLGGCSVCSDDQGTEENPLVYCDGCELAVHQACYGIVAVPPGNWFCGKCEVGHTQHEIKCELCPSMDGALKRTETGLWAHVVCALYIPEVRFGNNNTMEPIEIKHIQAERYSRSCYLCKEMGETNKADYGAVMDCHKTSCKQSFHVTCAQAAGLLCEEANQASDNVIYCGYCKHHFRKLKTAGGRKSSNSLTNNNAASLSRPDSASDSSQDNDSRCNTTLGHDKSTTNRNSRTQNNPTLLATTASSTTNSLIAPEAANKITTNSHQTPTSLLPSASSATRTSPVKNALISLTLPYNLTAGDNNKSTSSSTQKKKRNAKYAPSTSSDSSATFEAKGCATNSSTLQSMPIPTVTSEFNEQSNTLGADVYSWPDKDNDKASSSSSKNSKKKLTTANTQSSSAKSSSLTITQVPSLNLNCTLQKNISSPNLSLATSPSNSTKSNSSSSTASLTTCVTSSSSSSSTTSGSPSPAQISPNVSSRGLTATNKPLESPLATNSKTHSAAVNNNEILQESPNCNITLPIGQNAISTRINLDDPKIDLKKNPLSSSSLLSTTVPLSTIPEPLIESQTSRLFSNYKLDTLAPTKLNFTNTSSYSNSAAHQANKTSTNGPGNIPPNNTQPLVPPLVIPVPQIKASSPANIKTPAVRNKRKKSTDAPENPKTEPKPKLPSRSSKNAKVDNEESKQAIKVDTKKAGKASKAITSKVLETDVAPSDSKEDSTKTETKATTLGPNKRKSRSNSSESTPSPTKRVRKKKSDQSPTKEQSKATIPTTTSVTSTQPTTTVPTSASCIVGPGPLLISTPVVGSRLLQGMNSLDVHDMNGRYFSPMISPYPGIDQLNAPSLSRSSLSRLFSTSLNDTNHGSSDDITKAFDELRESTWNHLSKCVLEHAQQFDIPSLIGTLYSLRSENEKLVTKVRDLTAKRDQLLAMSARLDLPGPMLTQHLNNTSPNFSSVVSGLANSPKSLPMPSPGASISKPPLVSVGSYSHLPPGSLGPPIYGLDRSSPFAGQSHSTLNSMKPSSISAPSPPIGALMAHSTNIRPTGLVSMNPPYPANIFPPINTITSINPSPQSSAFYPRQ